MSLIKKLAGETALYGIPTILGKVLNFFILAGYYTRIFDAESSYNDWQQLYILIAVGLVIFTYRIETTVFRFGSQSEDRDRTFTTALSLIGMTTGVLLVLCFLLSGQLHDLFLKGEGPLRFIYYAILLIGIDALASVPFAQLRLQQKARRFAILKTISIFLNISLVLFFLEVWPSLKALEMDDILRIDLILMSNIIASLVVLILLIPVVSTIETKWIVDSTLIKNMFHYMWPLAVIALCGIFNQYGQFTMLQWLEPSADPKVISAQYAAATKLAIFMTLFTTAFNYAAEPFFFREAAQKKDHNINGHVAFAYTLVALLVFLGVTFYMDIIKYILGKDYHGAIDVVPIVMLAYLFLGLYYNVAIWYKLSNRTRYGMVIAVVGSAVTVVLNALLIPKIGYHGSAWATFACYGIMLVICYILGQLIYPISYPVGKILKYILVAIVLWQLSNVARVKLEHEPIQILVVNTMLLGFFGFLVYMFDKDYIKHLLSK